MCESSYCTTLFLLLGIDKRPSTPERCIFYVSSRLLKFKFKKSDVRRFVKAPVSSLYFLIIAYRRQYTFVEINEENHVILQLTILSFVDPMTRSSANYPLTLSVPFWHIFFPVKTNLWNLLIMIIWVRWFSWYPKIFLIFIRNFLSDR